MACKGAAQPRALGVWLQTLGRERTRRAAAVQLLSFLSRKGDPGVGTFFMRHHGWDGTMREYLDQADNIKVIAVGDRREHMSTRQKPSTNDDDAGIDLIIITTRRFRNDIGLKDHADHPDIPERRSRCWKKLSGQALSAWQECHVSGTNSGYRAAAGYRHSSVASTGPLLQRASDPWTGNHAENTTTATPPQCISWVKLRPRGGFGPLPSLTQRQT